MPYRRTLPLPFLALLCGSWSAAAPASEDLGSQVEKSTAALADAAAAIIAQHDDDPATAQFQERLDLVDQVSAEIVSSFEAFRSESLNELLDATLSDAGGAGDLPGGLPPLPPPPAAAAPASPAPPAAKPTTRPAGATELLLRYADRFAEPLPAPQVSEEDRRTLVQFYNAKIQGVSDHIAERGRVAATGETGRHPDALGLSLVLPLLHVNDNDWSAGSTSNLPEWVREPAHGQALEQFALRAQRPNTAYHLSRLRDGAVQTDAAAPAVNTTTGPLPPSREQYLRAAAEGLVREKDYPAAAVCLAAARRGAEAGGRTADAQAIRLRLAELYSDTDRPELAATEIEPLLDDKSAEVFGKAAVLRAKYLYEAKRYEQVLTEVARSKEDPRASGHAAQLLYLGWATSRQVPDATPSEDTWREELLQKFPSHPLAADVYFASAMKELAAGQYDEAKRILEFIEFRYPQSRIVERVKQIQKQLAERDKPPAASPAPPAK